MLLQAQSRPGTHAGGKVCAVHSPHLQSPPAVLCTFLTGCWHHQGLDPDCIWHQVVTADSSLHSTAISWLCWAHGQL